MDLFGASRQAIEAGTPLAYGLAFIFGMASSFGPCAASRVVIVAGITQRREGRPGAVVAAFLLGLMAVYVTFAFALRAAGLVQLLQSQIMALAAAAFFIAAVIVFVQAYRADDEHRHADTRRPVPSLLASFSAGAVSAMNFSPCCTPWLIMALTYSSVQGNAVYGAALMVVFALGHGLPLFAYGGIAVRAATLVDAWGMRRAIPLATTALMLFLCLYYAVQI